MSFQGFAREEQFSTNQIKIDIDSVINKDLAEASRMSKFMAANAAMGEKWNTMYLNALIKKHDVEKKNRERNFKFFMDNRAKIQEQIQYNNKVKMEDAERSHPYIPSFMDMLQPALMKMAVDVGAKGIQKLFDDAATAKAADEAKADAATQAQAEYIGAVASPEQMKIRQETDFIEILRNGTAEQIQALHERYAAAGDHRLGVKSGEWAYRISKLDKVDRDKNYHSPLNTSTAYQESLSTARYDINGADLGLNDVLSGVYDRSTYNAWMDEHRTAFMLERGLNSVAPEAKIGAYNAIRKVESQLTHNVDNNEFKQSIKDRETRWVNNWEHGSDNIGQRLTDFFDPNGYGPVAEGVSNERTWEWLKGHAQHMSPGQIRDVMSWVPAPGIPSINDQGPSKTNPLGNQKYRDWRAALDGSIARAEQGRENTQAELDLGFENMADSIPSMNQQQTRALLEAVTNPNSEAFKKLQTASPKTQQRLLEELRKGSGFMGAQSTQTLGDQIVDEGTTAADAAAIAESAIRDKDGKTIAIDGIPADDMKALKVSFRDTYRTWASGVADDLISNGWDPNNPDAILQEINSITRPGSTDPRFQRLQQMMQATWEDHSDPNKRLLVPHFPNMRKPAGVGEKSFVKTIETNRLNAKNNDREFSLADDVDWTRPEVQSWLRQMDMAIRYKHIDVQNLLSNAPSWVKALMRTQKYSSPGQIYQAAIDYGDYGDKYKRLSESDYMDYNEVKQQYDTFGNQFAHLGQHSQAVIAARHDANGGYTPNAATNRIYEINSLAKSRAMGDSSTGPHLDIKKVGGGNFSLKDLDNYIVVHDSEFGDSPLSRLPVTDTYEGHVKRGSHGIDIGIYAGDKISLKNGAKVVNVEPSRHGDVVTIELPNGEQFEWRHGTFSQGQPQQQAKTEPLVVPLPEPEPAVNRLHELPGISNLKVIESSIGEHGFHVLNPKTNKWDQFPASERNLSRLKEEYPDAYAAYNEIVNRGGN